MVMLVSCSETGFWLVGPPSTQLQLLFELPLLLLLNQKCLWLWLWFSHSSSSVPELPDQHLRLRVHWHRARVCRDGKPTAQCSLDEERRGSDSQWLFPDRSEWRLNWESSFGVVIIINILYYFYISYLITRSVLHSLPVLILPHSSLITSRVRLRSNVVLLSRSFSRMAATCRSWVWWSQTKGFTSAWLRTQQEALRLWLSSCSENQVQTHQRPFFSWLPVNMSFPVWSRVCFLWVTPVASTCQWLFWWWCHSDVVE